MASSIRWGGAALILLAGIALVGVAQQAEEGEQPAGKARTGFIRDLYSTNRATFGDAVRLVHAIVAGEPSQAAAGDLLAELREKGVADPAWTYALDDKLRKGTLAYMLVKALGIQGGLTMRVIGVTERYALRETDYLNLLTGKYPQQYVTGRDLIDTILRAEIYKKEGSLDSIVR